MTERYTSTPSSTRYAYGEMDPAVADRAYGYLLQIKNLDNSLMWTRSNIILLVQGGILAIISSQFGTLSKTHPSVLLFLSVFGLTTSYFWWRITKSGSFWVNYWQDKLRSIEQNVTGRVEIFRNHPSAERRPDIKAHHHRIGYISIRKTLIHVTFASIIFWSVICAYIVFMMFADKLLA